ncbi:MAG TPA: response regulator [Bacilli bacterium]
MYRLLIIDDEPVILDGMVDLFQNAEHLNLEIYKANTAMEALIWLERTKIDIVLSDIKMPGMNGLELQKEIHRQWPHCKVIFLTGHDDFHFVQTAIHNHSFDYLLKTDGVAAIVKSVERAAASLEGQSEVDHLINQAKKQMQLALPLLQREYLWDVLQGDPRTSDSMSEQFHVLQIPFDKELPVMLLLGRIDMWPSNFSSSDRSLLLYAVQNIAEEYLSPKAAVLPIPYERSKMIWLIQPKIKQEEDYPESGGEIWRRTVRFVQGILELIQSACSQFLKLTISFASASEPCSWQEAPERFEKLKSLLNQGYGSGLELLLSDANQEKVGSPTYPPNNYQVRSMLKNTILLGEYLENGQKKEYIRIYNEIRENLLLSPSIRDTVKLQLGYSLISMFLSIINEWGDLQEIKDEMNIRNLNSLVEMGSWQEMDHHFLSFAMLLFEHKSKGLLNKESLLIKKIREYTEQNLAGDLSLTKLGEVVFLNPSYLSRVYKQITGEGLSDYIMNARLMKAKELLKNSSNKIHEISISVGFEAPSYFHRFFKKATNLTPHEFREALNK